MFRIVSALFALIFRPSRFTELAIQDSIEQEFLTNEQLRKAYPDRNLPKEIQENFDRNERERTAKIRSAWMWGILLTLTAVLFGLALGCIIRRLWPIQLLSSIFQVAAAGIILSATLGQLGWEIQSYKGKTLPERANRWLFRGSYVCGTAILVASLVL